MADIYIDKWQSCTGDRLVNNVVYFLMTIHMSTACIERMKAIVCSNSCWTATS